MIKFKANIEPTVEQLQEWNEIEELVLTYQKQFTDKNFSEESKQAAEKLLQKFEPVLIKYLHTIRTGQINFDDAEIKKFVSQFIDDITLRFALKRQKQTAKVRHPILQKFNFIKKIYGTLPKEDILTDLQMCLLVIAKRYKQVGKNFCAYLHNVFCFEVARLIKKYTQNIDNIYYKRQHYNDYMQTITDKAVEENFEDKIYEDNLGIPDLSWLAGKTCSEIFSTMDTLERKILVKYYLEDCNDKAISASLGLPVNQVSQKRKSALAKLTAKLGVDISTIKRSRKPDKKF